MRKFFLVLVCGALLTACAGDFDTEKAIADIRSQSEFSHPLYAPLHLGLEVLTGENHINPDAYIKGKYATLLDAGLLAYNIKAKNSWRTLVELSLTEQASEMLDKVRTDDFQKHQGENDIFYVAVCNLKPENVLLVDTIAADTMSVKYQIVERDITPFGRYMGFEDGRVHNHNRQFVRSTFAWTLLAL